MATKTKKKSRGGRPRMKVAERRRHVIPLRVDDEELKAINRTARELGQTRSDLIRDAVMRDMLWRESTSVRALLMASLRRARSVSSSASISSAIRDSSSAAHRASRDMRAACGSSASGTGEPQNSSRKPPPFGAEICGCEPLSRESERAVMV